ncbi:MAG: hypothetical protein A3C84_00010 [Candidatus Ryanbacteria bacterium RIFCSPHIGHO2_02_FULL_48_12]|uniref:citrate synthase (unknown stereospecificity) n=1 Tax=Candidatus Ryanbacteria bacterium RIFCSPHIGHO2_01_FULL_48_27 TaxID=1802115 RepID=A0A1G2G5B4_9BACT|nr:MAG: hypothetical protein A2756_00350 [Candidatus Ryanbacteria bacterium RIFCSPHIGHO2_01_FULL_48_27]OGZ50490.1 MAG: hypothetical protein A3C84_00010 [Candidatus Ryanbacteria bacterium RIFCSPHIGHO2_02_FULL_48_12]
MQWETSISEVSSDGERIRGYRLDELATNLSFAETIWLILFGEIPTKQKTKLFEAMLITTIDHGIGTPSAMTARIATSGGATLPAAAAAGVLSLGPRHGGAITQAAQMLAVAVTKQESASALVERYKQEAKRLPGYGHKLFTKQDPRTKTLLSLARDLQLSGPHAVLAEEIETMAAKTFSQLLPLNIDGAIAALGLDMELPAESLNGIFLIGRMPGIIAHIIEEQMGTKPMRRLSPDETAYHGAPPRSITHSDNDAF